MQSVQSVHSFFPKSFYSTYPSKPGIAEMLDWAAALAGLGINDLTADRMAVQATLVCLLKTAADRDAAPREVLDRMIGKVA